MSNILRVIKRELEEAVFPTLFFFSAFHIVAATKMLMLDSYAITPTGVTVATVGALTVAKVVLIADKLSFTTVFSGRPLIFSVIWKTLIYGVLTFVFRCIEELIPLWSKYGELRAAAGHLIDEVSWPHFWALQIWLFVALILYNAITALEGYFGAGSMRKAFLS